MERYLYFSEAAVETTGENAMYPLASFRGMTPSGGAATDLHFESNPRKELAFDSLGGNAITSAS